MDERIISADHVAVGVDAGPLVVGNADELERAVVEEWPLDAATTGVDADPQKNHLPAHGPHPFRRTWESRLGSFKSESGLHG
jgi:hypothetical protein